MGWRESLKEASFRGAKFFIAESTTEVGRRSENHQFPFSEINYWEDLGKEAGVYIVEGYVIQSKRNGYNYLGEKNALKKALEQEGPGTLVHPFFGSLQVGVLGKAQIKESLKDGGMAVFIMTFVDAGLQRQVSLLGGGGGSVSSSMRTLVDQTRFADSVADGMLETVKEQFAGVYDTAGRQLQMGKYNPKGPSFLTDVQGALGKARSFIQKVRSTLLGVQATTVSVISKAQTAVREAKNTIEFVVGFPKQFADAVQNTLGVYKKMTPGSSGSYYETTNRTSSTGKTSYAIRGGGVSEATQSANTTVTTRKNNIRGGSTTSLGSSTSRRNTRVSTNVSNTYRNTSVVMAALKCATYGNDFDTIVVTTPERQQQRTNQYAIIDLVRVSAIAEAVRAAVYIDYGSYEEALSMMVTITNTIDAVIADMGEYPQEAQDDVLFDLLKDVKPFVILVMLIKGASLPIMKDYEVPESVTPSLMIAYSLYDDIERDQEIIDNNMTIMEHPGFPMGGSTLKVLSE